MSMTVWLAALSMGFFGSPHCLGMCGGIVTAFGMSMQSLSAGKKSALIATYHLGRLLSYSLLGLVASTVGMVVLAPFLQNNLPRVLLGAVLVLIGLSMCGLPFLNQLEKLGMRFWQTLAPIRKRVFPLDSLPKALFAGLLWGFLPCGLVYGALMMAVVSGAAGGTQSPLMGATMMFIFGLGTLPMLLATQQIVGRLRQVIGKYHLRKINGGLLILAGLTVMAMPYMMGALHGGHAGHGGHMEGNEHAGHDMSHMNHTMPMPATK